MNIEDEIIEKGLLIKTEKHQYIGVDDKVFIGITETYLYKGVEYYVDYEYQDVELDDYDYIIETIEDENGITIW